ncbi:DUF6884 domain-containing protein [Microlunatus sp. GCM10028923]|uniref:DUF6884 domain-containing protein n=1 Tax=Microlunatus sp. GCM10028923 TaxID=3273400 RepID=UPI00361CB190
MVTITFTLAGRPFELSDDEVRAQIAQHRPEPIHQYWVEIDGARWPVNQVMALATGLAVAEFQSPNCRRLLAKLGFTIGKGQATLPPIPQREPAGDPGVAARRSEPAPAADADVIFVGCVKRKRAERALAKDLYTSDYFLKMRTYAENSGKPWYILSAKHGLVSPEEWLEPYDCYLPDMTRDYRRGWGQKVASQLESAVGSLAGVVVDIHAGSVYVESVQSALDSLGAVVTDQLRGLSLGRRQSWYLQEILRSDVVTGLCDGSRAIPLKDFMTSRGEGFRYPGLYSWWVDDVGAADLTSGLNHEVDAGLIYAGLAGATRSDGSSSSSTLWGRIALMHLGKRHEYSTLRRSLGSILAKVHGLSAIDEVQLSGWMYAHLRVVAVPVTDVETLGRLESTILTEIDPPLNLDKVTKTPLRRQLSSLRRPFAGGKASRRPS